MLTLRTKGFSLVELMVVLTIMSILLLFAVPEFTVWRANSEVHSIAEALQNDLRQAQAEAVRRNRQVAFVLTNDMPTEANPSFTDTVTASNWALVSLPLLNSGETANEASGSTGFILSHIQKINSVTTVTGDASAICFNSVGRLATSSAVIEDAGGATCTPPTTTAPLEFQIQHPRADRPLRVQVRLGGQIRMCNPNKSLATRADGCA